MQALPFFITKLHVDETHVHVQLHECTTVLNYIYVGQQHFPLSSGIMGLEIRLYILSGAYKGKERTTCIVYNGSIEK